MLRMATSATRFDSFCYVIVLQAPALLGIAGQPKAKRVRNLSAVVVSNTLADSFAALTSEGTPIDFDELEHVIETDQTSEAFLALAALPLCLRRLVHNGCIACVSVAEHMLPDEAFAARRLRSAVVVCMLDAVPSVRAILGDDAHSSELVAVDGKQCLPASEVR